MTMIADPSAYQTMRYAMITSQLRTNAVSDQRVIAAMAQVPREDFVPDDVRAVAYLDRPLALGMGRQMNPPMATGRLLTEAYLEPTDRVLLIGAARGYAAAVLARVVAHVVAVEEEPSLVAAARKALSEEAGVEIVEAPLTEGYAAGGPYDVLVVDGAIENVPDLLVAQVKSGGRVVAGIVDRDVTRLASGRKTSGGFGLQAFADAECIVLPGFSRPDGFRF
jgi:protein-L-isoaspartate(D-aspartate) O-methyltransferase